MYDFIEGTLESIDKDKMTIATSGIGYLIVIGKDSPFHTYQLHKQTRVWTEFIVREDSHELYGFVSPTDRSFFRILQEVSGVGPKVALTISNASEKKLIIQAIASKNSTLLQQIPGIGKKLAERIAVDLHDKIMKLFPQEASGDDFSESQKMMDTAKQALKTLGFKEEEAKERLKKALKEKPKSSEELIQRALIER